MMKAYGKAENGQSTNHSDFGGDPVQNPDRKFLNSVPDHRYYTTAVLRLWCSLGGSIIISGCLAALLASS